MSQDTFLYWGMLVTVFLVLAALLTARELVEQRLEARAAESGDSADSGLSAGEH